MNKEFYNKLTALPFGFAIPPSRKVSNLLNKAIGDIAYDGSNISQSNPDDGKQTELWEVYEALEDFKKGKSLESEVELLLEIGDVFNQKALADEKFKSDPSSQYVSQQIGLAIDDVFLEYQFKELEVTSLSTIKLVLREALQSKNKDLESSVALSLLKRMRGVEDEEDDPSKLPRLDNHQTRSCPYQIQMCNNYDDDFCNCTDLEAQECESKITATESNRHSCPYQEEINDNHDPEYCDCDEDRTYECRMEI